jgi:thioredoxin reductase
MDADVVIIGGGSAGLQAALTLGRFRFDIVVVDAGRPSNAPAHAIGGLLGAHELAPLDLLATGRAQLAELPSVRLLEGEAARVEPGAGVTLADGTSIAAGKVLLATGADYAVPDVPGIAELWGTSVIHCPFCHGWESRDQRIGLLSAGEEHAGHLVPMLSRLTDDVEVFDAIASLRAEGGTLRAVVLPDGTEVERDVLFVAAPPAPRDAAFAHLELERTEMGQLVVDDFGRTAVTGVYAAGDLVVAAPAVVQALATAQRAAVGVVRDSI